jgi:tripartite-type tricarboxylate transporter receptor subunit TctC
MPRFSLLALIPALALASLPAAAPNAQTYPSKPIQLLAPFSPGNVVDLQARATAEELRKALGQQVTVVNKEGAAGMISFAELTRAAPDGYTLLFAPNGQLALQPHLRKQMPFDPARVDPICQVFETKFAIVVGESSPFKSFGDLVEAARKAPGKLSWGVSGIGSIPHLQWYAVEQAAGIETVPVPYKNYAQVAPDTASGVLAFSVMGIGSFGGQPLRVLLILDEHRSGAYPAAPAAKELGFPAKVAGYGGIYAAKGLAPEIRGRIAAACRTAAQSPELKAIFDRMGNDLAYLDGPDFAARLAEDFRIKGEAVRALKLEVE